MDENEPKKSPWGQLAQDLGAEPSSEAFQRSQPPAVEIPAAEATEQENDSEPPQQSPSDWNALANSLGLEVPEPPQPEPAKEPLKATEASSAEEISISPESPSEDDGIGTSLEAAFSDEDGQDSADPLPPLPSEVDQIMSEGDWDSEEDSDDDLADEDLADEDEEESGMSGSVAKNAFDALFNADGSALAIPSPGWVREKPPENAEGVVDPVDSVARASDTEDSNQENADSENDDKEQRPKRRRRRRGRGRGGRKTEAEQTPTEETADGQDALNGENREDSADEESSEESEKTRRRRPRRRSRRSASADNPASTGPASTDNSNDTDESLESVSYGDNELAEGRSSSNRDSTSHRNMPTWTEALSTIIEGNLELHSKAPSRQGSSRGRGRGRGGRGRKKT